MMPLISTPVLLLFCFLVVSSATGSGSLRGGGSAVSAACRPSERSLFSDSTGYFRQTAFQSGLLSAVRDKYARLQETVQNHKAPKSGSLVTRAVTGYLPGRHPRYLQEFRSLLLSVGVMRVLQPAHIKTDVVVFTDAATAPSLASLGCLPDLRRAKSETERCVVVAHAGLKTREDEDPLEDYPNADSVEFVVHLPNPEMYDFILRGDLDTFVTPGFADWIPSDSNEFLFVGHGGYGTKEAVARLRLIARELELPYNNIHNVGSTWYGATKVVIALSDFSTTLMRYLATHAFTEYERCCNGVDGWPRWHRPVISMYSGDLAVNVLNSDQVGQHGHGFFMDHGSDQTGTLTPLIKHIHCWHSRNRFSKFVFAEGGYAQLDLTPFVAMDTPADYSTVVAVSAFRLEDGEIRDLLANIEALKARKWLRATP